MIVTDAQNDPRVPATWLGREIGASLSSPILLDERVIGALHVIDIRARDLPESQASAGLALHSTRLVGGAAIEEVSLEYSVYARRSVAVAGLSLLLARAAEANASGTTEVTPLDVRLEIEQTFFHLYVRGEFLHKEDRKKIAAEVQSLLLGDRDLRISVIGDDIALRLTRRS